MLQMPPIKYPEEIEPKILEQDVALQGFLDPSVKVIFMDATPGYSDVVSIANAFSQANHEFCFI